MARHLLHRLKLRMTMETAKLSTYELSAQLLRTCQRLFYQGQYILLRENALEVVCSAQDTLDDGDLSFGSIVRLKFAMFDAHVSLSSRTSTAESHQRGGLFWTIVDCKNQETTDLLDTIRNGAAAQSSILLIQNMNTHVMLARLLDNRNPFFPSEELFYVAYMLKFLVKGKDVRLKFENMMEDYSLYLVKTCLPMRCKSIQIEDLTERDLQNAEIVSVLGEITSNEQPRDLVAGYLPFLTVANDLPEVPDPDNSYDKPDCARVLRTRSADYDDGLLSLLQSYGLEYDCDSFDTQLRKTVRFARDNLVEVSNNLVRELCEMKAGLVKLRTHWLTHCRKENSDVTLE